MGMFYMLNMVLMSGKNSPRGRLIPIKDTHFRGVRTHPIAS